MNKTFSSHWNSLREAKNIYTKEKKLSAHSSQIILFNSCHYGRNSQVFFGSDSVLLYHFSISTYSGQVARRGFSLGDGTWYLLVPTQLGFSEIPGNPKCDVKRSHATDWVVSGVTLWLTRASPSWKSKQTLLKPSNEQNGYKKTRQNPRVLTLTFVVALMSDTNDVTGCLAVLL